MATTHISISDYLGTTYEPDREYIDGELRERNGGTFEHAMVQRLLVIGFHEHCDQWSTLALPEWRVQVAADRMRIPDVTVVPRGAYPPVLTEPPLILIEVLSPDDTYLDTRAKAMDYSRMGVENIWLIDPSTRTGQVASAGNFLDVTEFTVANTAVRLELAQLFARFDEF